MRVYYDKDKRDVIFQDINILEYIGLSVIISLAVLFAFHISSFYFPALLIVFGVYNGAKLVVRNNYKTIIKTVVVWLVFYSVIMLVIIGFNMLFGVYP